MTTKMLSNATSYDEPSDLGYQCPNEDDVRAMRDHIARILAPEYIEYMQKTD